MCIYDGCKTRPVFNVEGQINGLYCSKHKLEGMVDVKDKTCIYEGCKIRPYYNKKGSTKALYCSKHKIEGMVDVKNKTCIHEGCKKQPVFNNEGETTSLYCSKHKMEGMVDVISKTCIHDGCKTRPIYNVEGQKKRLYCSKHKIEGMVDVINQTCIHEGCKTHPVFNVEGQRKMLYCSKHKLEGMINVKNKTCIHDGCKTRPIYNVEGQIRALYCSKHKYEGMVDVINKTCKNGWCLTQVQEKYDGYCLFCYINMFPDKPVSRNYKTKEYAVVEFVKTTFPDLSWIADKIVNGGCSKRRPDLLLDLGYQVIIIEIDENQHINYDCSCENKRIMELSQDVGHRPIVFIRFNPDEYEKDGTNITSCWSQNKKGLCVIKKTKKTEWTERLHVLEDTIRYWIHPDNMTSKTIEIIQLFYNL
jgi:hypothetical protein